MRTMLLGSLCVALCACAAKSAIVESPDTPEAYEVLNTGVSGFEVRHGLVSGYCRVFIGIKGGSIAWAAYPKDWCAAMKSAQAALATVPAPTPAPTATGAK